MPMPFGASLEQNVPNRMPAGPLFNVKTAVWQQGKLRSTISCCMGTIHFMRKDFKWLNRNMENLSLPI